jgi:hypothetical protein
VHRDLHLVAAGRTQRRAKKRPVYAPGLRRRALAEPRRPSLDIEVETHDPVVTALTLDQLGDPQPVVERQLASRRHVGAGVHPANDPHTDSNQHHDGNAGPGEDPTPTTLAAPGNRR